MALNLDSIKVLDAIARRGSFAAAADELDRAPSAISYSIQKLEEETGTLLFDRSGRRANLTAAGRLMLEQGRLLLENAQSLIQQAKALETGWETELTLAMDAVYPPDCLWPLVERFDQEAPMTTLRIISESLNGIMEALLNDQATIVIGALGNHLRVPEIRSKSIRQLDFIYVASPEHPASNVASLDDKQLKQYRAIAVADSARIQPPRSVHLQPQQSVLTVSDYYAKESALQAGLGIGTLPTFRARPLIKAKKLIALNVKEPTQSATIHLAWRADRAGKALRWLTRHLSDYLPK